MSRRAVIDVGSNSILLLIAESRSGGEANEIWDPILDISRITALGEGTKKTGRLSLEAQERSLAVLQEYFAIAAENGCDSVLCCGTMALRIAENRAEFLDRAEQQGTPVQIISGETEAELGFEAVVNDPRFAGEPILSIVDPGGHSTEVVTAHRDLSSGKWDVKFRKSFAIGSLMMSSQLLPSERNEGITLLNAASALDDILSMSYLPGQCGTVVVLGAAGTNLVCIRDGLVMETWQPELVHGKELMYEEISKFVGRLMPLSDAERAIIPGLEKGREKTIHHAALLVERVLFALRAETCFVSVRGWRHALLERGHLP